MVFKTCGGHAVPHRGVDGNGHAFLIEKEFIMGKNLKGKELGVGITQQEDGLYVTEHVAAALTVS